MFLAEQGFELKDVASSNAFGWARHIAEREEDSCQIYEYRNVEGTHVDVWEYKVRSGFKVYLNRFGDRR